MSPKDWIATFLAILALITSLWSARATRAKDTMAGRPHLHIAEMFSSSSDRHGLVVFNYGPGIGIVDEFKVYLDGRVLDGNWSTQWDEFRRSTGIHEWSTRGGFQEGEPVPANATGIAEILLIVDESDEKRKKQPDIWKAQGEDLRRIVAKRLKLSIKYHSEYDEAFEITKAGLDPERFRKRWLGRWYDWQP
jgi:hypothetical protein